jgi:hypothetical protein
MWDSSNKNNTLWVEFSVRSRSQSLDEDYHEEDMATTTEKEIWMLQAKAAADKAVNYLEMKATGAAKAELLNALAEIEKIHKSAA